MTLLVEWLLIIGCLGLLFILSSIEAAMVQSSPVALRTLVERQTGKRPAVLDAVLEDPLRMMVPLQLGTQGSSIVITVLTTHLGLRRWPDWGLVWAFGVVFALSFLFRQWLPRLLTQNQPEAKLLRLVTGFKWLFRLLESAARPLASLLRWSKEAQERESAAQPPTEPVATEDEIQAYLEIGEDEGIIEEEDSKLIQSVVEFGDTLVREVMTPRTRIVACEEGSSLRDLRDLMVTHRHSRIPVFREDLDHIVGIVYIRHLLARCVPESEAAPVREIVRPVPFVPETKPVRLLMRELQDRGDHAALVVDEFGTVSGLVTLEDLLEEIVGEIHDEDQARTSEVVEERPGTYIVRGSTELGRLEELTGRRLESRDFSTVAGLLASHFGRVPATGEGLDLDGLRIQILDADRKRVRRARVQVAETPPRT